MPPNTSLHRTPAAVPPSPVSSEPFGGARRGSSWSTISGAAGLIILLALNMTAQDTPPGFVWETIKPLKAKVLRVADWNHGIHDTDEGSRYGSYVNDDRGVPLANFGLYERRAAARKELPERVVVALMSESTQRFEATGPIKRFDDGPFAGASGFFSRGVQPEEGSTRIAYFKVLVSKTSRTGYVIMFESSETAWTEQWKIGQVIVNSVRLEPAR